MFFVPLNQIESVDLVIHALRAAGGQADCTVCPVRRVCTQQCLAIADAVERMAREGTLPHLGEGPEGPPSGPPHGDAGKSGGKNGLRVVK